MFSGITTRLCALSVLISVAACGGGGGGSPAPVGGNPPPAGLAITQDNMDAVAAAAAQASFDSMTSTDIPSVLGVQTQATNTAIGARDAAMLSTQVGIQLLREQLGNGGLSPAQVVGVVRRTTVSCEGGGSYEIMFDDADADGAIDSTDAINFSFTRCQLQGFTFNGALSYVFRAAYNADSDPLLANISMNQLSLQNSSGGTRLHGSFSVDTAYITNGEVAMIVFSEFVVDTLGGSGEVQNRLTINRATLTQTIYADLSGSLELDESVSGTWGSVQGTLVIVTAIPIQYGTNGKPTQGELLVTANSGQLRIQFAADASATVSLDAARDGNYEVTRTLNWDQLGVVF